MKDLFLKFWKIFLASFCIIIWTFLIERYLKRDVFNYTAYYNVRDGLYFLRALSYAAIVWSITSFILSKFWLVKILCFLYIFFGIVAYVNVSQSLGYLSWYLFFVSFLMIVFVSFVSVISLIRLKIRTSFIVLFGSVFLAISHMFLYVLLIAIAF